MTFVQVAHASFLGEVIRARWFQDTVNGDNMSTGMLIRCRFLVILHESLDGLAIVEGIKGRKGRTKGACGGGCRGEGEIF